MTANLAELIYLPTYRYLYIALHKIYTTAYHQNTFQEISFHYHYVVIVVIVMVILVLQLLLWFLLLFYFCYGLFLCYFWCCYCCCYCFCHCCFVIVFVNVVVNPVLHSQSCSLSFQCWPSKQRYAEIRKKQHFFRIEWEHVTSIPSHLELGPRLTW